MWKTAWRGFCMGTLFLLFVAVVASSQEAPLPTSQAGAAWNGPASADTDNPADRSQDSTSADDSVAPPAEVSAETPSQMASGSGNDLSQVLPDTGIRELGTPFPLQLRPVGVKIGPLFLTNVSDSFFYAVNTAPGEPTQTLAGNSLSATIVYTKLISRGVLAFQGREQFSLSGLQPFYNQLASLDFTDQLTERWTVNAGISLTYFQNSILANPQYLLSYTNSGIVQQTVFAQQNVATTYISNNLSASYQLSGRSQISFTPMLSANFLDQPGGWTSVTTVGGSVALSHSFSPTLSAGAFYGLSHSITSGASNTSPGWNSQSLGVSFQKVFRGSWTLAGSLAASFQSAQFSYWTPTGSITGVKAFHWNGALSAAYSRSQAAQVFVSSGYFDQGDISYRQRIGQKFSVNAGVGEFRTVDVLSHEHGKRAGASLSYQWLPRLSLNAGYNFAHQTGTQSTFFLGNTSYVSFGVSWLPGAQSGL